METIFFVSNVFVLILLFIGYLTEQNKRQKIELEYKELDKHYRQLWKQCETLSLANTSIQTPVVAASSELECVEPCHVWNGDYKVFTCATACRGLTNCILKTAPFNQSKRNQK